MFAGVALNVVSPEALAEFYVETLGMRAEPLGDSLRLSYGRWGACIELRQSPSRAPYLHDGLDTYWKIGITLPDIDLAQEQLRRGGVAVTEPRQFQEIGYMCHFADPEGFQVELLQHTFAGEPRTAEGDPARALGGGAEIGQVTLRTTDIDADLDRYQAQKGMTLLSVQPVAGRGFTLFFLADTDERPPDPDLEAVANRPWLWQRPYTTLELQHLREPEGPLRPPDAAETGFVELLFEAG